MVPPSTWSLSCLSWPKGDSDTFCFSQMSLPLCETHKEGLNCQLTEVRSGWPGLTLSPLSQRHTHPALRALGVLQPLPTL